MAISYVGGQVGGRAGSTSTSAVTFALTGGSNATPQAGDFVVITVVVATQARNPATGITTPTGYTQLYGGNIAQTSTTYDTIMGVSYKFMGSTPDTAFTLPSTGNVADAQRYTVQVFRGVDTTYPFGSSLGDWKNWDQGGGSGRPNPPALDLSLAPANGWFLIIGGGAAATGAAYVAPANFATNWLTGTTADTNDAMIGAGYYTAPGNGTFNPDGFTGGTTNAVDSWIGFSIFLAPAVTGTVYSDGVTEAASASHSTSETLVPFSNSVSESASAIAAQSVATTNDVVKAFAYSWGTPAVRFDFFTRAGAYVSGTLPASTSESGATENNEVAGYLAGGFASSAVTAAARKILFNAEAVSALSATLATARNRLCGAGSATTAYFFGGSSGTNQSQIDGVIFSTDAATDPAASLSVAREYPVSVRSSTDAYVAGGYTATFSSVVDDFVFASQTCASLGASLSRGKYGHAGLSGAVKGYWVGGEDLETQSGGFQVDGSTLIEGITYATETMFVLSAQTEYRLWNLNGFSSDTEGFYVGDGVSSTMDSFSFSTETATSASVYLSSGFTTAAPAAVRSVLGNSTFERVSAQTAGAVDAASNKGVSESATAAATQATAETFSAPKAYFAGGNISGGKTSVVEALTFSGETIATLGTALSYTQALSGGLQSKFSGFFIGGDNNTTKVDELTFGSDTVSGVAAALGRSTYASACMSSPTNGYIFGGESSDGLDRFSFANKTTTSINSTSKWRRAGTIQGSTYGYFVLGHLDATNWLDGDQFSFSSETTTGASWTGLTSRDYPTSGASNTAANRGYIAGGIDASAVRSAIVDGFNLSLGSQVTVTATLSVARSGAAGSASSTNAYFAGGDASAQNYSTEIDGVLISSNAATNTATALSVGRNKLTSVTAVGFNVLDRFTSEAASAVDTKDGVLPLFSPWLWESAAAVASHQTTYTSYGEGVFVCGYYGSAPITYTVGTEVFSFFNSTLSTGGNHAGGAASDFGGASLTAGGTYVGGFYGAGSAPDSGVYFWDFDADVGSLQSATLAAPVYRVGSVFSGTVGYFSGGINFGGTRETATNAVNSAWSSYVATGCALSAAKSALTGVSASAYGYLCGGNNSTPSAVDTIERITFAGETITTIAAHLTVLKQYATGVESSTTGYICAGADNSFLQYEIDTLVFSTETASANGSSLTNARSLAGGIRSTSTGYIAGGSDGATTQTADIESITFSSGAVGNPTNSLSPARAGVTGMSRIPGASSLTSSSTEAGGATAAHNATGSQSISGSAPATASDSPSATEKYAVAIAEAAAATAAHDATALFTVVGSAVGTANDAPAVLLTIVSSSSEAGSSATAHDTTVSFASAMANPATATDQPTTYVAFVSSNTAPVSASDAPTAVFSAPTAVTELGSGQDSATVLATFTTTVAATGAANDAPDPTYSTSAAKIDAATANDAPAAISLFVGSDIEATPATALVGAISGQPVDGMAIATAVESPAVTMTAPASIDNPATASDSASYATASSILVVENAASASSEIGLFTMSVVGSDVGSATDNADASNTAGGTIFFPVIAEGAGATDVESSLAAFAAAALGAAAATETPTVSQVTDITATEAAGAGESANRALLSDVAGSAAASASDTTQFISGNAADVLEVATASGAPYAVAVTFVTAPESALAASGAVAERVQAASVAEGATAADDATRLVTFFLSNDASAAAFDLSSVTAVFQSSFTADVTAASTGSIDAALVLFIQEMATAAAESARWLVGSEQVKRLSAFVTLAQHNVICYLKPTPSVVSELGELKAFAGKADAGTAFVETTRPSTTALKKGD